jgi:hypothetical protein
VHSVWHPTEKVPFAQDTGGVLVDEIATPFHSVQFRPEQLAAPSRANVPTGHAFGVSRADGHS